MRTGTLPPVCKSWAIPLFLFKALSFFKNLSCQSITNYTQCQPEPKSSAPAEHCVPRLCIRCDAKSKHRPNDEPEHQGPRGTGQTIKKKKHTSVERTNYRRLANTVCRLCASKRPRSHHPSIISLMVLRRDLLVSPSPNWSPSGGTGDNGAIGDDGEASGPGDPGMGGI